MRDFEFLSNHFVTEVRQNMMQKFHIKGEAVFLQNTVIFTVFKGGGG